MNILNFLHGVVMITNVIFSRRLSLVDFNSNLEIITMITFVVFAINVVFLALGEVVPV